jgi:hypothetical protein
VEKQLLVAVLVVSNLALANQRLTIRAFLDSNFRRTLEPKSGLLVPVSLNKRPYDSIWVSPLLIRNQNRGPLFQKALVIELVKGPLSILQDLYNA